MWKIQNRSVYLEDIRLTEAATGGILLKNVFLEISQNSQENTYVRVSFLVKLQVWGLQLYLKNRLWHRCFLVTFAKFRRTPFLKACVRYFLSNFHFSPNYSPSKTIKNVFYFIYKALFVLEIFKFLYFFLPLFFSLIAIALEIDSREILKFMMSSIV